MEMQKNLFWLLYCYKVYYLIGDMLKNVIKMQRIKKRSGIGYIFYFSLPKVFKFGTSNGIMS